MTARRAGDLALDILKNGTQAVSEARITIVHSLAMTALADLRALLARVAELEDDNKALRAALRDTLRALEQHLDEACAAANVSHRDILCPCNTHEVPAARAALAGQVKP